MRSPSTDNDYYSVRIHLDEFEEKCRPAPDAESLIAAQVEHYQRVIAEASRQITEVASRLRLGASAGPETSALATYDCGSLEQYKQELIRTKDSGIPALREQIEQGARHLRAWLQAGTLPVMAQGDRCDEAVRLVEKRIFGVELYAGLVEEVVEIRGGAPAQSSEPVSLFQRRHYMDEECLANYSAGGMRLEQVEDFEAWLLDPANLTRILPHPKSIVAFRVRRDKVEREWDLDPFVSILFGSGERDMRTYLYVRNGDRVSRLATGIDFGAQLYPDLDHQVMSSGKIYAVMSGSRVERLATAGDHDESRRRSAEFERKLAELPEGDVQSRWKLENQYHDVVFDSHFEDWVPWNRDSVYYDDITRHVAGEVERHNRLVLVLQGLFDRSEILHPHLPYKLWQGDDFARAVRLVYDDSRALSSGPEIDFEEYRREANRGLRAGSHVVGQQDYWMRKMADRENERNRARYGFHETRRDLTRYRPPGNPGPGLVAVARSASPAGVTFEWKRRRVRMSTSDPSDTLTSRLVVPSGELLCVDGYRRGDYKAFYADPRTRAKYLRWAPLLLRAEDWRAGKLPETKIDSEEREWEPRE